MKGIVSYRQVFGESCLDSSTFVRAMCYLAREEESRKAKIPHPLYLQIKRMWDRHSPTVMAFSRDDRFNEIKTKFLVPALKISSSKIVIFMDERLR